MPRPLLSAVVLRPLAMSAALIGVVAAFTAGCTSYSGRPDAPAQPGPTETRYDVRKNVVYTPAGHPQAMQADLYVPRKAGSYPGVVVVHGGGWNGRDRGDMESISQDLAERGFVVANIEYRLSPTFRHPAQLQDVRIAVSYLRAHALELKLDASRIGGWGYSAGGHLVTLAAMDREGTQPVFTAVVAGGVPADFTRYPESPVIAELMGSTYAQAPRAWADASPISHVSADAPPTFLFQGMSDRIVQPEEAIALRDRLQAAGVPVELAEVRGLGHIATFLVGRGARAEGINFLDRYLR